jgi:hypothetical protein
MSASCFCGVVAIVVFLCGNLPAERQVNEFFAAVETQDFPKAFGIWNNDADWQHTQRYAAAGYPYGRLLCFLNQLPFYLAWELRLSQSVNFATSILFQNELLSAHLLVLPTPVPWAIAA